ncbi:MAG: putative LPS assembly protein LptD [Bacteroidia bacterium]|nr:putative LPS assembly protein LptD [Bacteroidia bacterium]
MTICENRAKLRSQQPDRAYPVRWLAVLVLMMRILAPELAYAQGKAGAPVPDSLVRTLPPMADSAAFAALARPAEADTPRVNVDSLRAASDLKSPVTYQASDSIVFDLDANVLLLYRESALKYDDLELKAYAVTVAIDSQLLTARGLADSAGVQAGEPVFTQGQESYQAKSVRYNFSSRKGRITGGKLVQGEMFIQAEAAKYHPDGSFHGQDGIFTTCNDPHPHFYVQSRKMKVLPDKKIISGPLNLVVGDLPLPVVVPFAFVPKLDFETKQSGVIKPQFGEAQDRGFFLRQLGYYLPINDYFDLRVDGDIYTRGGWRLGLSSNYRKKYWFDGNFGFEYGITRFNEKTDPDFQRTSAWSLRWSHNQPIDPTARLSASVNISSSNRFQRQISANQNDFFTNTLNSSISFQKTFNNLPFSVNLSARHTQDLNKEVMSMQLPELSVNMNRQTPFKFVDSKHLNWLKQFGITYNMQARNAVNNLPDSLFLPVLFRPRDSVNFIQVLAGDTVSVRRTGASFYTNGLQHTANASTTIRLLKNINISPNFNYAEYWYLETLRRTWNDDTRKLEEAEIPGFARGFNFSGGVSASTNFFGIYQLTRSKRQITIRQRFTSSLALAYKPNFADPKWGFYRTVQTDTAGRTRTYSIFERGIYGGPTTGESRSLGISLSSVLEMKYRKKESFEPEFDEKQDKFIRMNLIDNIGLNTGYNFAADSFRLAPVTMNARTSLLDRLIDLNASATLDPYVFASPDGVQPARRLDRYMLLESGRPGRITTAQVSVNTRFSSKKRKQPAQSPRPEDFSEAEFSRIQANYDQYVDFNIPWNLNLRYSLSYRKPDLKVPQVTQTLNLDGDFNFTEKWKVQFTSGLDLSQQRITQTSVSIFRDLHCFQMSLRWVPYGPQKSYSVVISAKSATLSALRLTKNEFWQDRFRNL